MRVWDVPAHYLCNKHLLAQHLEVHTMYSVIVNNKKGYSKHPETLRWVNNLDELVLVHNQTALEMIRRGFNHYSAIGNTECAARINIGTVTPLKNQIELLCNKKCECKISGILDWYNHIYERGI